MAEEKQNVDQSPDVEVKEEVEESKEITETKQSPLSRVSGKGGVPLGFENMDMQTDIQMPRIAILQGLSAMAMEGKAPAGKIVNVITKEVYGDELIFIPLFLFKSRAKFRQGEGLVCSSRDALSCSFSLDGEHAIGEDCMQCEDSKWPDKSEGDKLGGPPCSLVYNYPVLNCGNLKQFPASISLMRTAVKGARILNSILRFTGEDFFSSRCRMTTQLQRGDKGDYYTPIFELIGKASDEEYALAKKFYMSLQGKIIEVELEEETPEY